MVAARYVRIRIVTDDAVFFDAGILIQYGALHLGAAADIAVVQDHAIFHKRSRVHAYAAPQYGIAHHAARQDAAAGHDAVDRLSTPIGFVEGELGRRIGIAGTAQRPLPVI